MPIHDIIIDINCDLGEIEGDAGQKLDSELLRWITSANVACGGHAGSRERIRQLAEECRQLDVGFGAHPGYVDREGFGRRVLTMSPEQIYDMITAQLELMIDIAASEGVCVSHVKPHGALYNLAAIDIQVAQSLAAAVHELLPNARLFGLAGSRLLEAGKCCGLRTVSEVFADRNYQANGTLVPRDQPGAVIHDPQTIAARAARIIDTGTVVTIDGHILTLVAETICVHSDSSGAVEIAKCLKEINRRTEHPR